MKRTIEWRLSEAQKNLILRAIVNCPCDAGIGETEHDEHHAQLRLVHSELEALGYIGTQRGRGTYVAARLPRGATAAQASQLEASARGLVSQAYLAGLQLSDVIQLIKDADREISGAPGLQPRKEGRQR